MTEVGLGSSVWDSAAPSSSPRMRRSRAPASRSSTPTGSATRPAPRPASIRTSGAGTRRASRSPTRTSTRRAPRPSCGRCSRASGATACCRTSASPTAPATSPAPSSGRPSSRRTRRPHPRTSGIVQPPVHATAVWQVYRNAPDVERAEAFLRELMPRLAAWHDYLYRERTRDGEGLVEIWHPWESGIDNSPLWDEALGADHAAARGDPRVPARRHRGRRLVAAADERRVRPLRLPRQVLPRARLRPGARSAPSARSRSRTSSSTRSSSRAGQDLAAIARVVGEDPGAVRACGRAHTLEPRLEALERGRTACTWTTTSAPAPMSRLAPGAGSRRCTAASSPERASRLLETVREFAVDARRRLGGRRRCRPTIPRSTRPATGAGRSGP